jgi:SAM-dependent methyltransferase
MSEPKLVESRLFYDHISAGFLAISNSRAEYLSAVDRLVSIALPAGTLADLGTGDGVRLSRLTNGLEVSITALEPAYQLYQHAKAALPGATVLNLSFEDFSSAEKFDCILALWNVLGHVRDRSAFLKKVSHSLRDRGIFIFDVNNRYNIKNYGILKVIKNLSDDLSKRAERGVFKLRNGEIETSVYIYSLSDLRADLTEAGLVIKQLHFINYDTGRIGKSQFSGQIFAIAARR